MRPFVKLLSVFAMLLAARLCAAGRADSYVDRLRAEAERGAPKAQIELALKYEYGEGVAQDTVTARQLLCEAAKRGNAEAQFQLGWMYANGRGVAHDDSVAAAVFALAAEQGHEYAAKMLRYVHARPGTSLPRCLRPDPGVDLEAAGTEPAPHASGPIRSIVYRLAPQYGVDPELVLAVIATESGFNSAAISPKSAWGLMQLIPATAERFRVRRVWDPIENIRGGLSYLRWLSAYFRGNVALVLAAYNAGERAVDKFRGIPPYAETRDYVKRITRIFGKRSVAFDPGITAPSPIVSDGATFSAEHLAGLPVAARKGPAPSDAGRSRERR